MSYQKNLEDLLKAASSDNVVEFTNVPLDVFFKVSGFSTDDLSARIYMDELYYVYAEFYYKKFKKLPHRKKFASGSNIFKHCRIRRSHPTNKGKLSWGIKCSQFFKQYVDTFKEENTTWQKKYKRILGAKLSHRQRKVNRKENQQLEELINVRHSKNDSSQK